MSGEIERDPWPEDWAERRDPGDYRACRRLWIGRLRLMLHDVAVRGAKGHRVTDGLRRLAPADWLGTRDFHMTAALAGFDGEAIRDAMISRMADPDSARALADALRGPANSNRVGRSERA